MRTRKKIKRNLEVVFINGVIRFARILPRGLGFWVFTAIGRSAGALLKKDRARAIENLAIGFPEAPVSVRKAMTRAMFATLGRNLYEFLNLEGSTPERVQGLVERVEGQENLDEAMRSENGLIAITGHIGCWELLAAYWAGRGYSFCVIGKELWEKRINDRVIRIRESVGYRTIARDGGGKEILRILKNRGIVAALIDQHTRVSGVYVPFFNKPAHTPVGVAKLALRTGAKILPMAIYMVQGGKHVIRILPALDAPAGTDEDERVRKLTEDSSNAIEKLVRYDPKQWVWFHNRWRDEEKRGVRYATVN